MRVYLRIENCNSLDLYCARINTVNCLCGDTPRRHRKLLVSTETDLEEGVGDEALHERGLAALSVAHQYQLHLLVRWGCACAPALATLLAGPHRALRFVPHTCPLLPSDLLTNCKRLLM